MPDYASAVFVSPWSLLIRGILAALRQDFHLSACPNFPGHLYYGWMGTIICDAFEMNSIDRPIPETATACACGTVAAYPDSCPPNSIRPATPPIRGSSTPEKALVKIRMAVGLAMLVELGLAAPARAAPDCGRDITPALAERLFDTSPYAMLSRNPWKDPLWALELPTVSRNGDGTCTIAVKIENGLTDKPVRDAQGRVVTLRFGLRIAYRSCQEDRQKMCPYMVLYRFTPA